MCYELDADLRPLTKRYLVPKTVNGKKYERLLLEDVFRLADHQANATCALGYTLPLEGNQAIAVKN